MRIWRKREKRKRGERKCTCSIFMIEMEITRGTQKKKRRTKEEEKKLYTEQLSRILDYFSELDQVDTTGVEPMSHPVSATNVLRSDAVVNPPGHEKMLKTAPDKEDAFFRVPKISD